jgi:hypothetical protein
MAEGGNDLVVSAFARSNVALWDARHRRPGRAGEASPMDWGVNLTDRAERRQVRHWGSNSLNGLADPAAAEGHPCGNYEKLLCCYRAHHNLDPIRTFVNPTCLASARSRVLAPV